MFFFLAYKTTYGDNPVWTNYRRNFKGPIAPKLTRYSCVVSSILVKRYWCIGSKQDFIHELCLFQLDERLVTGNPCPICRDVYLVVHEKNTKLLQQFISPQTDQVMPFK